MTDCTKEKIGSVTRYIQCIFTIVLIVSVLLFTPVFSNVSRIDKNVERLDRI